MVNLIEGVGFSAVHFLYYRKKYPRGGGHLVHIDNDSDVCKMISEHKNEKSVQFYVFRERANTHVAPTETQHDDEIGSTPESIEHTLRRGFTGNIYFCSPQFKP